MWTVRAAAAVCVAALCACGGESYGALPPPAASAPAVSGAVGVAERYRQFWVEVLPAAAAAAPAARRAVLAVVTAEPELTHLVRSLAALDAKGQRNYGTDVPVRQRVRVNGATALVEGCLDSSRSGVADAATGRPLTRGVARNPVRADLIRAPDGGWRIAAITYPSGTSC